VNKTRVPLDASQEDIPFAFPIAIAVKVQKLRGAALHIDGIDADTRLRTRLIAQHMDLQGTRSVSESTIRRGKADRAHNCDTKCLQGVELQFSEGTCDPRLPLSVQKNKMRVKEAKGKVLTFAEGILWEVERQHQTISSGRVPAETQRVLDESYLPPACTSC
jgi:hypothetical protein